MKQQQLIVGGHLVKFSPTGVDTYMNGDLRVWDAVPDDLPFVLYLNKRYRNHEYFFAPDASLSKAIDRGNLVCFSYAVLEAGYVWTTSPKRTGAARVNHVAVHWDLWRNRIGSVVMDHVERRAASRSMTGIYLSCNSNTPGHGFWPELDYTITATRKGAKRGGFNHIWAKLLPTASPHAKVEDVKRAESYFLQYSMSYGTRDMDGVIEHDERQLLLFDLGAER